MNITKPIIGYHATDYKFEAFDDAKTGYVGHYFSLNNTTDGDLPTLLRYKKYTITAKLNVNNPAPFEVWRPVYDKSGGGNPRKISHDRLRELGYDCIIRGEEIVVFDGSNIDIIKVVDNKTGMEVESIGFRSFKGFIESLKRDDNKVLIESIMKGYNTIFESSYNGKELIVVDIQPECNPLDMENPLTESIDSYDKNEWLRKYSLPSDNIRFRYIQQAIYEPTDEKVNIKKLTDTWDGYDDLTFVERNGNTIRFYEGFVKACWDSLYNKPEYRNLNKEEAVDKMVNERFNRIANDLNLDLVDYKFDGKHLMIDFNIKSEDILTEMQDKDTIDEDHNIIDTYAEKAESPFNVKDPYAGLPKDDKYTHQVVV